jgi:hypothetical protein
MARELPAVVQARGANRVPRIDPAVPTVPTSTSPRMLQVQVTPREAQIEVVQRVHQAVAYLGASSATVRPKPAEGNRSCGAFRAQTITE